MPESIDEGIRERVISLASVRGETPDEVIAHFGCAALRRCPRRFPKTVPYLRAAPIVASGVDGGHAYVVLQNGCVLFGAPSNERHRRWFPYVYDVLPPALTEEAFAVGLDVGLRYLRGGYDPPFAFPIAQGATVVEVGAYVGHLSLWFADQVGPAGRVIAIELIPENASILRRNIAENAAGEVVDAVESGAWSSRGTRKVWSRQRQQNSLVPIEQLSGGDEVDLPVDTIDNILDDRGVQDVDVAFITVNGAEVDVLKGFRRHLPKTAAVAVADHYEGAGRPMSAAPC